MLNVSPLSNNMCDTEQTAISASSRRTIPMQSGQLPPSSGGWPNSVLFSNSKENLRTSDRSSSKYPRNRDDPISPHFSTLIYILSSACSPLSSVLHAHLYPQFSRLPANVGREILQCASILSKLRSFVVNVDCINKDILLDPALFL